LLFNVGSMKKLLVLLTLCIFVSGCGLHLRQPGDLPIALNHMKLESDNVNDAITTSLERQLTASKVSLTDPNAPLVLTLSDSKMDTQLPIIFNANADTSYTYTLSVNVKLTTLQGENIVSQHISASEAVLHNVNQVSPPVFTPLMRSSLTQRLVNNIYALLISQKTLTAINNTYADN